MIWSPLFSRVLTWPSQIRSGRSSDLDRSDGRGAAVLAGAARAERAVLHHVPLPFGLSVLAVGRVRA